MYKEVISKCAFNDDIIYTPLIESNNPKRQNTRKRKITWFNPPYSMNVETNIGKIFLKLEKKHFPRNRSFHKIFNKNNVNISHSCVRNINSIIESHNKFNLRPKAKGYCCNSSNKESCSLQNQCLTPKVIYEATVVKNSDDEKCVYFGASDTAFKKRYRNHTRDFNQDRYTKCTELSKYICQLNRNKKVPSFEWKNVRKVFCDAKSIYCV